MLEIIPTAIIYDMQRQACNLFQMCLYVFLDFYSNIYFKDDTTVKTSSGQLLYSVPTVYVRYVKSN